MVKTPVSHTGYRAFESHKRYSFLPSARNPFLGFLLQHIDKNKSVVQFEGSTAEIERTERKQNAGMEGTHGNLDVLHLPVAAIFDPISAVVNTRYFFCGENEQRQESDIVRAIFSALHTLRE